MDNIKKLIYNNSVDLIVVGANKLEARRVKETLKDIAEKIKNYGMGENQNEMEEENKNEEGQNKEAFV